MAIWCMCSACRKLIATNTHSEYVILAAFLLQQWLRECFSMLRDTYLASRSILSKAPKPILRPIQPPIPRMMGAPLEVKLLGQATTPDPSNLVPRLRICAAIPLFPHTSSCRGASLTTAKCTMNQAVHIALKG